MVSTDSSGTGGAAVELVIGPTTLDMIQAALDAFWSRNEQVPRRVRLEVGIAVAEVAGNILEHSKATRLNLEIELNTNRVQVDFVDDGHPAEVNLMSAGMPDEMSEQGRGLALALSSLSGLSYWHDSFGNHWSLTSAPF